MASFEGLETRSEIGIWGYGSEGRAVRGYLNRKVPDARITVLVEGPPPAELAVGDPGVAFLVDDDARAAISHGRFQMLVKSPGISLYRPEIEAAKRAGTKVTSSTNLWFWEHPTARKIAVTGTKGKSTTSRLIHHLLTLSGLNVQLAGNVGIPLIETPPGRDATVIELSSYQTADLETPPDIAVFTNLFPEHGPWHGGHEIYYRDKLRMLDLQPAPVAIANRQNPLLTEKLRDKPGIHWQNDPTSSQGYAEKQGELFFANRIVPIKGFALKGRHNLGNLALALSACEAMGVSAFRTGVDLSGFHQLAHRMEEFTIPGGILGVNDSISTVPEATIAALSAYAGREIILILGGADRGQDYAKLTPLLNDAHLKELIVLPETGRAIAEVFAGKGCPFPVHFAETLRDAVALGMKTARAGDVFLLSPAAPSFGQFRNFEERGELFKSLCLKEAGTS